MSQENSSPAIPVKKKMTLKEGLAHAFLQMVEDEKVKVGVQPLADVRRAVTRRLRRSDRDHKASLVTSVHDMEKVNEKNRLNFLVKLSKDKITQLNLPNESYFTSQKVPMRILLKETQEERILSKH